MVVGGVLRRILGRTPRLTMPKVWLSFKFISGHEHIAEHGRFGKLKITGLFFPPNAPAWPVFSPIRCKAFAQRSGWRGFRRAARRARRPLSSFGGAAGALPSQWSAVQPGVPAARSARVAAIRPVLGALPPPGPRPDPLLSHKTATAWAFVALPCGRRCRRRAGLAGAAAPPEPPPPATMAPAAHNTSRWRGFSSRVLLPGGRFRHC